MGFLASFVRWQRRRTRGQALRRSSGQALVEFALLLPMLMLLLIGAIDFGRIFYVAISVQNAAFVGALYASQNAGNGTGTPVNNGVCTSPVASSLRTVVVNELQNLSTTASVPTVTCTTGAETGANSTFTFTAYPACNTTTCGSGTCSGSTCTGGYRYVEVAVSYTFTTLGPYDAIVERLNVQRAVRMRVRP